MAKYVAMWSGPRNISTAMMRAWGNRPDTFVCDEPLYAHYLSTTGRTDHPGYREAIAHHETDWRRVVEWLTGPIPGGKTVFYQKHMAHHLLPGMSSDWTAKLANCLLIRDPADVLLSLTEFLPAPTPEDTGLPQQVELFHRVREVTGAVPPVLDARDVLNDPPGLLTSLCDRLDVPFSDTMLSWPPGPRDTDGAWGPLWYAKLYDTTGFGSYRPKHQSVPDVLQPVLDRCRPLYEMLYERRLRPAAHAA